MSKKLFMGDKFNDTIIDIATFISSRSLHNYHLYSFRRMTGGELNPKYAFVLWYNLKEKEDSGE